MNSTSLIKADKLKPALSSERLDAYQQRTAHNGDLNFFSHYAWNMALS
ncbi:hypothetical protein MNBD_GAMMA18-1304 [hydrothermal vent metagenome]|uniref:Uncharacterized protein n=1 Tax=hydrothermal vent metagenome TaxID=652676 RepID=A0A3B1A4Q9_9ZZZZ